MEKLKAFIISIVYGLGLAVVGLLILITGFAMWNQQKITFLMVGSSFFALFIPFCILIPAIGHLLVRQKHISRSMLWVVTCCTAVLLPMMAFWLYFFVNHFFDNVFAHYERILPWSIASFPLCLLFMRISIAIYLNLLKRSGIMTYFEQLRTP